MHARAVPTGQTEHQHFPRALVERVVRDERFGLHSGRGRRPASSCAVARDMRAPNLRVVSRKHFGFDEHVSEKAVGGIPA